MFYHRSQNCSREYYIITQLSKYLKPIFSPHMSGFRKNYSCQRVLLRFIEDVKLNLDNNKIVGTFLFLNINISGTIHNEYLVYKCVIDVVLLILKTAIHKNGKT